METYQFCYDDISHYARSQARPSTTRLLFQLIICGGKQYHHQPNKSEGLSLQLDYFCYDWDMTICSNHCNGLVCLYSYAESRPCLYNVTTREIKPFPKRILSFSKSKYQLCPKLFLGFDQVTGNYKLLHRIQGAKKFQILTLRFPQWGSLLDLFLVGLIGSTIMLPPTSILARRSLGIFHPLSQVMSSRSSSIRTALWGKLAIYCQYGIHGPPNILVYDEANKVFGPTLLGEERIIDKMKKARLLATTSVISVPASLLSSSATPNIRLDVSSFFEHNKMSHFINVRFASRFVENIIPLTSELEFSIVKSLWRDQLVDLLQLVMNREVRRSTI
ncbi:putative F-box protein [Capsicum chacoense]